MKFKAVITGVLSFFRNIKKSEGRKDFEKLLPVIYAKTLVLGFALTGLTFTFFPKFVLCLTLFGNTCDPVGNYFVAIASLPGYLVASILLFYFTNISSQLLIIIIVLVSFVFYFLAGLLIDRLKVRKKTLSKTQLLVVLTFLLLVIALFLVV